MTNSNSDTCKDKDKMPVTPLAESLTGPMLRQRAQAQWNATASQTSQALHDLTPEANRALLHELQVHQIELELQNEELLRTHRALEESRALYFDLYDLAPVGYCTVSESGLILQANLTLTSLLKVTRNALVRQPLSRFISAEDQDIFYQLHRRRHVTEELHSCELRMVRGDGAPFWVQLDVAGSDVTDQAVGTGAMRVVVADIGVRKRADEQLQVALKDKDALLKEVHHRVKNNLQVITSLLRLESRRSASPEAVDVLQTMQGRIRAMAQLHELLYRSGTFSWLDLGNYLGQIAKQAFHSQLTAGGLVQLKLNLGTVPVGMDQAVACGLLVNELVSNCLKHGFPNGRSGEVCVELQPADPGATQTDALWRLRVSDTGVGLSADFEARSNNSLGLQLVSDLSQQAGGTLTHQSQPGVGAAFAVVFTALVPAQLVMPQ